MPSQVQKDTALWRNGIQRRNANRSNEAVCAHQSVNGTEVYKPRIYDRAKNIKKKQMLQHHKDIYQGTMIVDW